MARTRHIKQPRSIFIVLTLRSSRFRRESEISRSIRFNAQSQLAQQCKVDINPGIFGGEQFVAEENGIGAGEKAERLAFA